MIPTEALPSAPDRVKSVSASCDKKVVPAREGASYLASAKPRLEVAMRWMLIMLAITGIAIGVLYALPAFQDRLGIEEDMLKLINQERQAQGLNPVAWSEDLHDGARGHSEDMAKKGVLVHAVGPFSECVYFTSGSIMFIPIPGYPDTSITVRAWMDSPGHRAILLDPTATIGAVGIDKDYATYRCR